MGNPSCYQPSPASINSSATVNGSLTVQSGTTLPASVTLLAAGASAAPVITEDGVGDTIIRIAASGKNLIVANSSGGSGPFQVSDGGIVKTYANTSTTGNGMPAEIAGVATGSPVALATSSTSVLSLASGSVTTGTYLISLNAVSTAAAQVATFTVVYEDNSFSVAATATITSGTLGSGGAFGQTIEINAKTGTAITISGSCTTASDVKATAHIFGPL